MGLFDNNTDRRNHIANASSEIIYAQVVGFREEIFLNPRIVSDQFISYIIYDIFIIRFSENIRKRAEKKKTDEQIRKIHADIFKVKGQYENNSKSEIERMEGFTKIGQLRDFTCS